MSTASTATRFIRDFIFIFGGFTQTAGSDSGMMRLWARLFRWRATSLAHAATLILPRRWKDDPEEMTHLLERHVHHTLPPRIVIAGYSWGAGYGAIRLAKRLRKAGHDVDLMILVDPVYRSRLPAGFRLLAFTTWFGIRVPDNVKNIIVWRQSNHGPRGTHIIAEDANATTFIGEHDLSSLGLTHATIQYHTEMLDDSMTRIVAQLTSPQLPLELRSRR